MSANPYRLGQLQLQIMQILWEAGSATVAEVHQALPPNSGLAYTTVATMLRKMETRQLVEHQTEGRRFVYRPRVAAGDVTQSMANDLLNRLFEGSLTNMVSHLLSSREVSSEELDRLESLIAHRKQSTSGDKPRRRGS